MKLLYGSTNIYLFNSVMPVWEVHPVPAEHWFKVNRVFHDIHGALDSLRDLSRFKMFGFVDGDVIIPAVLKRIFINHDTKDDKYNLVLAFDELKFKDEEKPNE